MDSQVHRLQCRDLRRNCKWDSSPPILSINRSLNLIFFLWIANAVFFGLLNLWPFRHFRVVHLIIFRCFGDSGGTANILSSISLLMLFRRYLLRNGLIWLFGWFWSFWIRNSCIGAENKRRFESETKCKLILSSRIIQKGQTSKQHSMGKHNKLYKDSHRKLLKIQITEGTHFE